MQYTDLKDGMICYLRDGRKCLVLTERMYEIKRVDNDMIIEIDNRGKTYQWSYEELMILDEKSNSDIIKVEYMGEIIWERVDYVSFMEAVHSERRFKHKKWGNYYYLCEALRILSDFPDSDVEEIMSKKEWVIEQ